MSSYGGGISTFIQNIASQIQQFNIQFDVVTYTDVPASFRRVIQSTGGDVYQLKNPKKAGWSAFKQSYTRVLELYPYDVIHCHIAGYRAIPYKWLARTYGIKRFYIHAHHVLEEGKGNITQMFSNAINQQINRFLTDGYLGCSSLAIKSLFGYQINSEEMMRIPNSIDAEDFLYDDKAYQELRKAGREAVGLGPKDLIFGQIGRLDPIKNHQLTIDIAQYMEDQGLPGCFLIFGEGELRPRLEKIIKQRRLQNRIILMGRVSPIYKVFPILDCLIFPSFREGLGTVAIESQAADCPVVMSSNLPKEADLGLGLVRRLHVKQEPKIWYENLVEMTKQMKLEPELRLAAIQGKQYTNQEAARLYARLLKQT